MYPSAATKGSIRPVIKFYTRCQSVIELKHLMKLPTRQQDVVATSLCTSQQRCSYVSNETPNNVSVERHQDFSVIRLLDILLERCDDVSRGHNSDVSSVRLLDVSNKSQMKHLMTSQWYVNKTLSGTYPFVPLVRLYDVYCKS